jgi:hypothetical protein
MTTTKENSMTLIGIPLPDVAQTADDQPPTTEVTLFRLG